jgi:hypothetical protein
MTNYESTLFHKHSINELTSKVQSRLGITIGDGLQVVPRSQSSSKLSSIEMSKICSIISAYRLLDVVAMLDGVHPAPSVGQSFMNVSNSEFRVSVDSQNFISS